jgi:hypothetical protein
MISTRYGFIFLHVPKTAGNSINTVLLPYSDDQKIIHRYQDGIERFGVKGSITPHKHASLGAYHKRLGSSVFAYKVAISVRHPVHRMLSLYFSPHKWMRQDNDGNWYAADATWSRDRFLNFLARAHAMTDYLKVDGQLRAPDHVLRYERLEADLDAFSSALGLPCRGADLPRVNVAPNRQLIDRVIMDRSIVEAVQHRFGADMDFFGYEPLR